MRGRSGLFARFFKSRNVTFPIKNYLLSLYFVPTFVTPSHGSGWCAAGGHPVARWPEMGTRAPVAMLHIGL